MGALASAGGVSLVSVGASAGVVYFGIVDTQMTRDAMDDDEIAKAKEKGCTGETIQFPIYVSPIAVAFNLKDVDSLNLSAPVIADIFSGKIKTWNDPAIAKENEGVDLPDTKITPVNRSDESGTSKNFSAYLSEAAPENWKHEPEDVWPIKGGEAAKGTSGVVDTIGAGDTFNAGILDALHRAEALARLDRLDEPTLTAALTHAARAAAVTVSRPGADPPWPHELA